MDIQQFKKLEKVYCEAHDIIKEMNRIDKLLEDSKTIQLFGYLNHNNYWIKIDEECFTDILTKYIDVLYSRKQQLEKTMKELKIK